MLELTFMTITDLLLTALWTSPHDLLQGEHYEKHKWIHSPLKLSVIEQYYITLYYIIG